MIEPIVYERIPSKNFVLKIKQQQVILTASICLIALAIVLKNVLFVPTDILIRDMEIYIIIYIGFSLFTFKADGSYELAGKMSPLVWDALIVLITLAIIGIYAL